MLEAFYFVVFFSIEHQPISQNKQRTGITIQIIYRPSFLGSAPKNFARRQQSLSTNQ